MTVTPPTIAIAVPTYRRPDQLRALLDSLSSIARDAHATIIVIDNDPAASARPVIDACEEANRPTYIHEERPGVAHARNAAIDAVLQPESSFRWLAFIDDDERPEPSWLRNLLSAATQFEASIVTGPVNPEYAVTPESWIVENGFFDPPRRPTGMELRKAFTGNMLVSVDALRRTGIRFDIRLTLSGGEDVLFSRQFAEAGERITWCAEAEVTERQPAERLTRTWIMQRAFRIGTTTAFVERAVRPRVAAWVVILALGLYKMLKAAVFFPILGWLGPAHRAGYQHLWTYGRGMIRGLFGHVHDEYARSD